MNSDLVSIIVPVYNSEDFIMDTINSIKAQTYKDFEVFLCDDLSTDSSLQILGKVCNEDSRFKLVLTEYNTGPALARNRGLSLATGRFVAFLDSDDIWTPDKLKISIDRLLESGAGLVYTAFQRFIQTDDERVYTKAVRVPDSISYSGLLGNNVIATSTVVIDRHKVPHLEMRDTYYDDFDCWLRILKSGVNVTGINSIKMHYRIVSGSVSRNKLRSAKHVWRAFRDLENLNFFKSSYFFLLYVYNGFKKYM